MGYGKRAWLAGALVWALAGGTAWAGETVVYTGSGNVRADDSLMPLASGDAVTTAAAMGVAALSTTPPMVMDVRCSGMGIIKAGGDKGMVFYCTFTDSLMTDDAFDIKGVEGPDGTRVEVVGGSGRWQGATGTGSIVDTGTVEPVSTFEFEFEIVTP